MAQGRQQNNGSRQRCAQSAAAKAPAEPPKAVCAQLEQMNRKLAAASAGCGAYAPAAGTIGSAESAAGAGGRTARAGGSAACSAGLEAPDQIGAPLGGADELVRRYDGRMTESWMTCKKSRYE